MTARRSAAPRVLLIVENVPLARDHRLRKQATALVEAGYDVTVICRRDRGNACVPGVRLREYWAPPDARSKLGFVREYGYALLAASALALLAFLRRGVDLIQVSGTPDIYFLVTAPYRLLGIPVVFDQRELSPELFTARYGGRDRLVHRLLLRLERASYRRADHVLTVNGSLRDIALSRGGVPQEAVTVVGNGPRLAQLDSSRPLPGLRAGRSALCVYLGLMGPQDRVELAVRAVAHLVHELGRTDVHVAFVGDGESRQACVELARELGVKGHTSFPGWAEQTLAFHYLATADVGLEPNLEAVVSPVKAMEYMAFGVPVVAFDVHETRRLVGDAGLFAEPGDAAGLAVLLDRLLGDPALRRALGDAGRRRVAESVAWEHQAVGYLEAFAGLRSPVPS